MAATVTPTRGESLLLWRRRKNLNQVEAAKEYGVPPDRYREWEADRRLDDQPRRHLGELKPHEVCFLLRRRAGKTQREVAAAIGCTRFWVIKMEGGKAPVERLREYWGF
jgi:hypothetical protein